MYNIYIYPKTDYQTSLSANPYISDFEKALSKHNRIVNVKYNKVGILDCFRFFFITNVFIFNWIENLPGRRYGKFQVPIFAIFLIMSKIFKKRIVWVLHNKYSHDLQKNFWTDYTFRLMLNSSDLIITHSLEGIEYVKSKAKTQKKIKYFIHPVRSTLFPERNFKEKKYDFIIWGSIFPYKGILEFLEFKETSEIHSKIKILIVGKCKDMKYKNRLYKFASDNISFIDEVLPLKEISILANSSKFILFTHKPSSVLSSGALMDSIRMGCRIIGPNHGAFKDLSNNRFMKTYDTFEDIREIYEREQEKIDDLKEELKDFCEKNSWCLFSDRLQTELDRILKMR